MDLTNDIKFPSGMGFTSLHTITNSTMLCAMEHPAHIVKKRQDKKNSFFEIVILALFMGILKSLTFELELA